MSSSFEGVRSKLDRAKEHFDTLKVLLHDYETIQCTVTPHEQAAANFVVWVIHFNKKLPSRINPLIGDCLFNMRSALDHLAYVLSSKPDGQTMFPICRTAAAFSEQRKRGRLSGFSDEQICQVESLQPYRTDSPLGTLARLHNVDKHRTFNLVSIVSESVFLKWGGTGFASLEYGQQMRDGDLLPVGVPKDILPVNWRSMEAHGEVNSFVAFGDLARDDFDEFRVDTTLEEILKFIWYEVVPALEPRC